MAVKARYTRLLVNQWDFSGDSNSLETTLQSQREDCTAFQASAKEYFVLGAEGAIKQQGYFNDTGADTFEEEIAESILNADLLTVAALYGTDTAACPAYVARGATTDQMNINAAIAGMLTLGGSWVPSNGLYHGLRMYSGTITATGTTTYIDLGAAGSAGGYAWLFVQDITGSASGADIVLQSDDNTGFGTPANEGTFTFSAVGAVEIALGGTVDRYVRLNTTDMGGATNFTVVAIVAVAGVTY